MFSPSGITGSERCCDGPTPAPIAVLAQPPVRLSTHYTLDQTNSGPPLHANRVAATRELVTAPPAAGDAHARLTAERGWSGCGRQCGERR